MKRERNRYLLIDIDHTISNAAWRDSMLGGDWDEYHSHAVHDDVHDEVVSLIRALGAFDFWVICITTRPEKWRKMTTDWLLRHRIPIHELLMRPDNDTRPSATIKSEQIKSRFTFDPLPKDDDGVAEVFFIDDNDKVIEAIRGLNVTTLHLTAAKRSK